VTRLRKIFYDKWGWNKELIRAAASIEGRYEVKIVEIPPVDANNRITARKVRRYRKNDYSPKYRLVTYRKDDKVYGCSRYGQTPFIYQHDHQEVLLPEGYYCDIAHVLAGIDAFNNLQIVSPLPSFLLFLHKLLPYTESNQDIVTWLGDIATSSEDFMFAYLRNHKKPIDPQTEQHYIDIDAPGSDMLGDIDSYVICKCFDVSNESGRRITDILQDYYMDGKVGLNCRRNRIPIYCEAIGLKGWNGRQFSNEKIWLNYYRKQLRNATTFMIFSLTAENFKSIFLPFQVWTNKYKEVVKVELLLRIYLKTLKSLLNHI
jgi:hypothetical protein